MADARKASNKLPSGVTLFAKQAAAPSVNSAGSQIYAKEVAGSPSAELLLHFDDDVVDSANGHSCTATSLGSYVTSGAGTSDGTAGSGLGFDKAADFTGSSYIVYPDLNLGTADLTISWWAKHDHPNMHTNHFSLDTTGTTAGTGIFFSTSASSGSKWGQLWDGSNKIYWDDLTDGSGDWYKRDTGHSSPSAWRHFAITRTTTSGGNSQWDLFFSGKKCTPHSTLGHGTPKGNWTTTDIGEGGRVGGAMSPVGAFRGNIDEFAIFKSIEFSGSTYTVPTEPVGGGGAGATKLFVMDSDGLETQLG